jgi:hypothetical protein
MQEDKVLLLKLIIKSFGKSGIRICQPAALLTGIAGFIIS